MSNNKLTEGVPSWIVLMVEDPKAATRFYSELLGWKGSDEATSDIYYDVQLLQEIPVAAVNKQIGNLQPKWRIHIDVANLETATKTIITAGGKMAQEPIRVKGKEQYTVFADPAGVQFAVHQGREYREYKDAELRNVPGSFAWSELITDDVLASYAFYQTVFGWTLSEPLPGDKLGRREWLVNGCPIAGLLPRPSAMPKEIPPYWDVFFSVEDPAATVEKVVSLGGKNLMLPLEIPHGQIAVFLDSGGTVFSVIKAKK